MRNIKVKLRYIKVYEYNTAVPQRCTPLQMLGQLKHWDCRFKSNSKNG
jgi:hypothetical protein